MGMKFHTDKMGDLTTNIGIISYSKADGENMVLTYDIRKALNLTRQLNVLQMKFKNWDLN